MSTDATNKCEPSKL